eukprot:TRINITY_DN6807_c0_g1_i1.p1 TRINITY_DN6807_c0_g1~~TRINITY_DN6807_c0_g1_i1.p1  ORF type:complete len:1613 (+),score=228.23 TRINITY_DN6807_c0_g1_i1:46-4884(+)
MPKIKWLAISCIFHVLFLSYTAAVPQVLSATYEAKDISLLGRDFSYGVYEVHFNEDIAVLDNMPCPCFDSTVQTCNISTLPAVDETGYDITLLTENTPLNVSMEAGSNKIFKFNLQPSTAHPCPIVVIRLSNEQGPVDMYVSNREIPSQGRQMWTKPYWGRDSVWLCPTLNWFGYGTYYITAVSQIGDATNRYTISYYIKDSPGCPATRPTKPYAEPTDNSWQWIDDGQVIFGNVSQDEYHNFRYLVNSRCANISASGRRQQFEAADIDIYAALGNTTPTLENYEWNANMDGDDSLVISVCAPQAPFVIYFSVTTYLNRSPYAFTVTHTSNFEVRPVTDIGAHSISWLLARGADLDCGQTVFACHFGPYPQCYGDGFRCCFPFYFLPPTANPNPIWPRNGYDPVVKDIISSMRFGPYDKLQSKKLAFGIQIDHRTSGNDYTRYVDPSIDLSKCTLRWRSLLVGASSAEPLTQPVTFTTRTRECNSADFAATTNQINAYMDSMYSVENQGALTLAHLKLAFTAFSASFRGCTTLIDSLTTPKEYKYLYDDLTNCNSLWGTAEYDASPCCSSDVAYTQCCAPYALNHSMTLPASVMTSAIQSQCRAPECSTQVVSSYVRLLSQTNNVDTGCSAAFRSEAGSAIIADRIAFIRQCREEILGVDLLGKICSTNADCLGGRTCLASGRCAHDENMVMDCFAERIDPVVGTFLLRRWGVSGAFSQARLRAAMPPRIFNSTCVGGNAIPYRDHYWYQTTPPFCRDDCKAGGLEPRCLGPSCTIPEACDRSITSNSCWRFWSFNRADSTGCLADRFCSWIDCAKDFPGDPASCEAACTDSSVPTPSVCVRCSDDYHCSTKVDIENFNQSRCALGLCSVDPNEASPSRCATLGACSAFCRGAGNNVTDCTSEAACQAAGVCSDINSVGAAITLLGGSGDSICILPFSFESGAGAVCSNSSDIPVPSGCATAAYSFRAACVNAGGYWHTLATDAATCTSAAPAACFDTASGVFLNRSRAQCDLCSSEWRSPYSWSQGQWTPGTMIPLRYVTREWRASNTLGSAINYPRFTEEVGKAIADKVSTAFLTEALCRFDNLVKTIGAIACDCTGASASSSSSCFSAGAGARQIGVGRVCPSLANNISVSPVTIYASPTALASDESCRVVKISLIPNDQYALSGLSALTSEIFKQRITNLYAVARNSLGAVVGQILSDGIDISYDGSSGIPMRVCINTVEAIPREDSYTRYDLAVLDTKTNRINVLGITANATNGAVCGPVSASGTVFAVATLPEWRTVQPYDQSQRAQSFVGSALYYFVVAFGLAQGFILVMWDRRNMVQRLSLLAVVTSFNLIRGAYLTLAPGTLDQAPGARYIFFELPTFLFFSAYSVVLYLWTLVIQRSQKMGNLKAADRAARLLLLILNIIFYVVFVVFVILFATYGTSTSPCAFSEAQAQSRLSNGQRNLGIAYQAVIALICMVLALIFCVQGVRLVMLLRVFRQSESKARSIRRIMLTATAAVCTISFVIRSAVFVAASAGASLPVIVFVLLEVIPSLMVQWIMNPWNGTKQQSSTTDSSRKYSTNSRVAASKRAASVAPTWNNSSGSQSHSRSVTREPVTEEESDTGESL